jgi:hypothetical protein
MPSAAEKSIIIIGDGAVFLIFYIRNVSATEWQRPK